MNNLKSVYLKDHIIEKNRHNINNLELDVYSVTNNSGLIKSDEYFKKNVYSKNLLNYKIIESSEIAYNPSRINVGSIAICNNKKALLSPIYVIFQCDSCLDERYLVYFLKSKEGLNRINHYSQKGVRHSLNFENLGRIQIKLPSLPTQEKIISLCDHMQKIRKKRELSIDVADGIITSTFVAMFGDPIKNPMKWNFVDLKTKLLEEPQNGIYVHESSYGSGTPIARIDSFYGGILNEIKELKRVKIEKNELNVYQLYEDDIILSRTNSLIYLGKCALIEKTSEPIVFESNMMRIKVNKNVLLPEFLIAYLQTNSARLHIMKRAKRAANQVSINQEDVMSLKIPDIEVDQQKDFAKSVQKWFSLKKHLKTNLTLIHDFISSIEFELFEGRLVPHNVVRS